MTTETVNPTAAADDPMTTAMNPVARPSIYFGEVRDLNVWFCVLAKGVGKTVYDPGQHSVQQRRTAIQAQIIPLHGSFEIPLDTIDSSKDWLRFTLPSLRALDATLLTLAGRYCQVERVSTGETYVSRTGEEKTKSALKFVAFYDTREECEAAQDAYWNGAPTAADGPAVMMETENLPF